MKQSNKDLSIVFFNSVEDMNECYDIDAKLPSKMYGNADLVCYEIVEPFVYKYLGQYVITKDGCHHLNNLGEPVIYSRNGIKSELSLYENDLYKYEERCFVYVRVNNYLRKHLEKTLIGCEFVNNCGYQFNSKRKFIHFIVSGCYVEDQNGIFSSLDSILLYPDDYSDPIPYKEWVKKIND